MGLEGAVGLTDVLVGRADLEDVLQPWADGGILLLPSGAIPPNPSELLGSQQMKDLLAELEQQVDLVLIDAPPLLPVTDAAVLATDVSGAIVVVRAGRTTRDQVGRAVEVLRGVDAHVYGVVLNMVPARGPASYGYGYGYGATAVTIPAVPAAAGPPGAPDHRLGLVAGHGPQPAADPACARGCPVARRAGLLTASASFERLRLTTPDRSQQRASARVLSPLPRAVEPHACPMSCSSTERARKRSRWRRSSELSPTTTC